MSFIRVLLVLTLASLTACSDMSRHHPMGEKGGSCGCCKDCHSCGHDGGCGGAGSESCGDTGHSCGGE